MTAGRAYTPFFMLLMGLCILIIWGGREAPVVVDWCRRSTGLTLAMMALFVLAVVVMFNQAENPFIYFRF